MASAKILRYIHGFRHRKFGICNNPSAVTPTMNYTHPISEQFLFFRVSYNPTSNLGIYQTSTFRPSRHSLYRCQGAVDVKEKRHQMKFVKPYILFADAKGKNGRLLGLDVNHDYIGLAISDEKLEFASNLCELPMKASMDMAKDFRDLISEYSVQGVVIGDTFHWMEHPNPRSLVEGFVKRLSDTGILHDVKYTYWNKPLTDGITKSLLEDEKILPQDRQEEIRVQSTSMLMLQEYLIILTDIAATASCYTLIDLPEEEMRRDDANRILGGHYRKLTGLPSLVFFK